jgi:hypothetical protein
MYICRYMSLSFSLWLYSPLEFGRFFSFLILYTVGRIPWTGHQPVSRPLPTHGTTQTQNKCTRTSMPLVGFEPTITVFERAKTFHALDCAATVIGCRYMYIACFSSKHSGIFNYNTTLRSDMNSAVFMKHSWNTTPHWAVWSEMQLNEIWFSMLDYFLLVVSGILNLIRSVLIPQ